MIKFPQGFLWGAATSAYQVEGANSNSDWWHWEKTAGKQQSGFACRHYELYKQDFDLAKSLNHNCHRLSLEWSRIEPQEGQFNEQELAHYLDALTYLKSLHIEPVVTLYHFTLPEWLSAKGGWLNRNANKYFLKFVRKTVEALGNNVRYWITINEPLVYATHSYVLGVWPPQQASIFKAKIVLDNLAWAHIKSYRLIKDIYERKNLNPPLISISQNLQAFRSCQSDLKNRLAVYLRDKLYNFDFIERLLARKTLDFIGVNYYGRNLAEVRHWGVRNLFMDNCEKGHLPLKKNSLGWDIYPEGLQMLLMKMKKYKLPVFITENGICTQDDNQRWLYIAEHLKNIHSCLQNGVNVIGYLYWSLIDNFEWDKGFTARFGIVEVDYNTYKRTPRPSAERFSLVARTSILDAII